ncbi:MAG: hypothetical protein QOH41_3066 [Blastocatellia bacterium]|nr:hypothetical protein [Blastocatellia bacterium]
MPIRGARRHVQARDVLFLMTSAALLAVLAESRNASSHVLGVNVIVIALSWIVARRVAIQTTRMFEHWDDRSEELASFRVVSLKRFSRP